MGVFRNLIARRWRTDQLPLPEDKPSLEELHRAVAAAVDGRADDLASSLLAVSRCGDTDLIASATQALIAAPSRMWLGLDVSARRSLWHAPQWTATVARRVDTGQSGPLDLLLAACHPDGFLREAAVAAIAELDDVVVLPVLVLRAADWVSEVRDRARQACLQYLETAPAEAITFLAPVAFALRARQAGSWLADALDSLLRDGPPEVMTTALAVEDRHTRRAAHIIGLRAGRLSADQMVHAATTDPDLPVRLMCAEAAISAARAIGDRDIPRRLLASGTAAVRAEAVHTLGAAGEVDPAVAALSDRSALVRATAQAIVRRAGMEAAVQYRALLAAQQPPSPSVIAGLGETGIRSDTDLLQPWLTHPTSRGRAEAVRALRRHGCTSPQLLLPLLTDPMSSVTRQVTLSLRPQADTLDEHSLRLLLHQPHPRHVRMAACRLLRAHGTWARVSVDLQLIDDPEYAIRTDALADLTNWLTYGAATTYAFPHGPRADELAALLPQTEAVLGAEKARLLRFHLGLTG